MLIPSKINLGLIGRTLSHSFSKRYFEEKYGITNYFLIELESLDELPSAISTLNLNGFNVTIPYKRDIIPLLDDLDPVASEIGAVNTVAVKQSDNQTITIGYNTDAPAFLETLRPYLAGTPNHRAGTPTSPSANPINHSALILGTGGASLAVAWALRQLGIEYRFVSRQGSALRPAKQNELVSYDEAYGLVKSNNFNIIINATPVGMHPNADATPWRWPELLTDHHLCYDLVYNPSPTLFLQQAASRGATTVDGLDMLHRQADLALEIWTSQHNIYNNKAL